jgi:hypothetical protein
MEETMFKSKKILHITVRPPHSWHHAYASALKESDPNRFIGRVEYAISTIEKRYSEWATDPGSPAELKALQKCISALRRRMKQEQMCGHGAVPSTR